MQYNLFTPQTGKLNYPHLMKLEGGEASIVTHPDKIMGKDDVIYSEPTLGNSGHFMSKRKVVDILEQRTAKGQHSVDFVPVFQKLKTELL